MVDASDIITYIGVPLAVLGVLPIIYTFTLALTNQRRIRRALLRHNHRPLTKAGNQDGFAIRSSPMTTLIEVELPKYAIAPLDRRSEAYWTLSDPASPDNKDSAPLLKHAGSTLSMIEEGKVHGYLRGGSWRAFRWKRLIVGRKMYRVQYEDELREPPAEIDFTELVHFLQDWGAQLDPTGWEKLRQGGLWTPAGTVLMHVGGGGGGAVVKRPQSDWVLRTSMPDESDGILTLCVKWPKKYGEALRSASSLPPGWGRLYSPRAIESPDESDENKSLSTLLGDISAADPSISKSNSFRFKVEHNLISTIYFESSETETGHTRSLSHLTHAGQLWFTSAASSLLLAREATSSNSGTLWGFTLPERINLFVTRDTIPCGVLVLLDILPEDEAPTWTVDPKAWKPHGGSSLEFLNRSLARDAAIKLENTMPPNQAAIARSNRLQQEGRQMMEDVNRERAAQRQREEIRMSDALSSSRMNNAIVAEWCLKWLIKAGEVGTEWTVADVLEAALYLLALDTGERAGATDTSKTGGTETRTVTTTRALQGQQLATILDEWMDWSEAGGMKNQQLDHLRRHRSAFCLAACVVAIVQEAASTAGGAQSHGKASLNMLECLDMWRTIRLG